MPENLTVQKSDNQGDKEETFIQTCRRDEEGSQQGGGCWTQRGGGLWSRVGKAAAGATQGSNGEVKPQTTD